MAETDFGQAPLPVADSWETMEIQIGTRDTVGIEDIEWSGEQEIKLHYGKGVEPVSYSCGKIKHGGKFTVDQDEYRIMLDLALPYFGEMIKVPPLPVIIKTKGEGGATKTMFFIKITKEGHSYKQGDEKTIIPFDFTIVSKVLVTKS